MAGKLSQASDAWESADAGPLQEVSGIRSHNSDKPGEVPWLQASGLWFQGFRVTNRLGARVSGSGGLGCKWWSRA